MHNITELVMGKRSKAQDRTVDFNGTEYKKFIYMVLDSTLQLTCKKLPVTNF